MVDRFHKVARGGWSNMRVTETEVTKRRTRRNGVVMFPSMHDITPEILGAAETVIGKLLAAGNRVLVVSKPHFECIDSITIRFEAYQKQLMFRFTVGSPSDAVLGFWEPGAPSFEERLRSLRLAFERGFRTSISAEPLLDPDHVKELWDRLIPYVNWEFWIGKLNRPESRIDITLPGVHERLSNILEGQTDERVMQIVAMFRREPLVRWKDSYKEVIMRYRAKER